MVWRDIFSVFKVDFVWNTSTITLGILWIIAISIGYYLMASQVKLVKKEIWQIKDSLKCVVFAFFFGTGFIIIITMMETFLLKNQDLPYEHQAPYIILPIFFCLTFITIYPLFDFLVMANTKTEISVVPIQKPLEKLIKKLPKPYSYLVAIGLYLVLYPGMLFLLIHVFNIEIVIAWISWTLIYPMSIISYYASLGYVIGFWTLYSRIPDMERSTFLAFDSSKRGFKEFLRDPMTRIVWGTLIYTYFATPIMVFRTLRRLSLKFDVTAYDSVFKIDWFLPIALGLALSTFFTRYWKRKIKLSTQSIFFSAFLIAAVGVNILVNYTIVRPTFFKEIFEEVALTRILYEPRQPGMVEIYSQLNLIGVIEELTIVIVINYYFHFQKNHRFIYDTLKSSVTSACENFKPIPGFNMLRYKKKEHRAYAQSELIQMYERIPFKKSSFTEVTLKDPLMDAICDPTNNYAKEGGKKILGALIEKYPEQCKPLINEAIYSNNFDKTYSICELLIKHNKKIDKLINKEEIYHLLTHCDFRIRFFGSKCLNLYYTNLKPEKKESEFTEADINRIKTMIPSSNNRFEVEILKFLSNYPNIISENIFLERLKHPNIKIQEIATKSLAVFNPQNLRQYSTSDLQKLLEHSNPAIEAAALEALAKVANFEKNNISINIFLDRILHQSKSIRNAAIFGVLQFLKEKQRAVQPRYFISILQSGQDLESDIKKGILRIMSQIWQVRPAQVIPIFIQYLKSNDYEMIKISQNTLIKMASQDPNLLIKNLIKEEDTQSFIKRGKITDTIIKIGEKFPQRVKNISYSVLKSSETHIRKNACVILNALAEKDPKLIEIDKIIPIWREEKQSKNKKLLNQLIAQVGSEFPDKISPYLDEILTISKSVDTEILDSIANMILKIAKNSPQIIPREFQTQFLSSNEQKIKEKGIELLGYIGKGNKKETVKILLNEIENSEWTIKNAAIDAISKLGSDNLTKKNHKRLKKLLHSSNKWTRRAILDFYQEISKNNQTILDLEELKIFVEQSETDSDNLVKAAKIIGDLATQDFDKAFYILVNLMKHEKKKVREGGVAGVTRLSKNIKIEDLLPKLLQYLSDESSLLLQESIAKVLQRVVKYEKKSIKNRVVSLLRIRAATTQNEIISEVLADLEN